MQLVNETPIISSFPSIAATMTVLQSNKNKSYPWIMSNYIQLLSFNTYYEENWPMHIVSFLDAETSGVDVLEDCELLKVYKLPRNFAYEKFLDGVEFIKYAINNEFYIHCTLNHKYFVLSRDYNRTDFMHSALVYGYDKNNIYIQDFIDLKGYKTFLVSNEDFNKSFISTFATSDLINCDYYNDIQLVKMREVDVSFNINKVRLSLSDYIHSCDSTNKYSSGIRLNNNMKEFGVACYNNIVEVTFLKKNIDIRPFHVLYDHKILMKKRIKYLIDNGYIKDKCSIGNLIKLSNEVVDDTLNLRNVMIKNAMIGFEAMNKKDFANKIWDLKSKDIRLTNELLIAIK